MVLTRFLAKEAHVEVFSGEERGGDIVELFQGFFVYEERGPVTM